jgi:hypothetical protein
LDFWSLMTVMLIDMSTECSEKARKRPDALLYSMAQLIDMRSHRPTLGEKRVAVPVPFENSLV